MFFSRDFSSTIYYGNLLNYILIFESIQIFLTKSNFIQKFLFIFSKIYFSYNVTVKFAIFEQNDKALKILLKIHRIIVWSIPIHNNNILRNKNRNNSIESRNYSDWNERYSFSGSSLGLLHREETHHPPEVECSLPRVDLEYFNASSFLLEGCWSIVPASQLFASAICSSYLRSKAKELLHRTHRNQLHCFFLFLFFYGNRKF